MSKKNERNAGRNPKFKKGVETTHIRELVPKNKVKEVKQAIKSICEPYLTELTNKAIKKLQDESLTKVSEQQLKK